MKKVTFKEWYQSEGFEDVRFGTNDMVNSEYLYKAFHANDNYIEDIERAVKSTYEMTAEEYLYLEHKL